MLMMRQGYALSWFRKRKDNGSPGGKDDTAAEQLGAAHTVALQVHHPEKHGRASGRSRQQARRRRRRARRRGTRPTTRPTDDENQRRPSGTRASGRMLKCLRIDRVHHFLSLHARAMPGRNNILERAIGDRHQRLRSLIAHDCEEDRCNE